MKKIWMNSLLAATLLATPAWAGQSRGQKHGNASPKGPASPTQRKGGQQGSGGPAGIHAQQRQRTQVNSQQRRHLEDCSQAGARAGQQARAMKKSGRGSSFDAGQARQERDRLQVHVQEMAVQHQRFMGSLDDSQRNRLQAQSREIDQIQDRMRARLHSLNDELGKESPSARMVRKQAGQLEKETKKFQKQYRRMENRLDRQP